MIIPTDIPIQIENPDAHFVRMGWQFEVARNGQITVWRAEEAYIFDPENANYGSLTELAEVFLEARHLYLAEKVSLT